jgi:hypothetical protein
MNRKAPAILRNVALSRRTFLRAGLASIALPTLSAMTPAGIRRSAPPPVRVLWIFAPNGQRMDAWKPAPAEGPIAQWPRILEPLRPHAGGILVVSGLGLDGADAQGDGPGDHARAAAAFLTCAHPRKTGGKDLRAGISADQALAEELAPKTALLSLEIGLEPGRGAGICDSGYSCAYSNTISWRTPAQPLPKEVDPRRVFARLFGDPDRILDAEAEAARRRRRRSMLDLAREDARSLQGSLGPGDRHRLEEYLDSLRELERRLDRLEPGPRDIPLPPALREPGSAAGTEARLDLLYELIVLAWRTDTTRIVSFMLGNAGSNRSYPDIGVHDGHHDLSHHGRDPQKLEAIERIGRFHMEAFARFLGKLRATEDGPESLFDHALCLYGSGISDGDSHSHHDLPVLVAGRGGGLPTGRHLLARKTPLANLHLALLHRAGSRRPSFGDSTGVLL